MTDERVQDRPAPGVSVGAGGAATTRERILELVEALMMERGFNAISYQDVASRIGIRKASIHYHFPSKGDLGAAVIRRYRDQMHGAAPALETLPPAAYPIAFGKLLEVFATVARSQRKVCLGGVLGAEFETLPEAMQNEVRLFYIGVRTWLSGLLELGQASGAFRFEGEAQAVARSIIAMIEGALIIHRALGEEEELAAAFAAARRLAGLT